MTTQTDYYVKRVINRFCAKHPELAEYFDGTVTNASSYSEETVKAIGYPPAATSLAAFFFAYRSYEEKNNEKSIVLYKAIVRELDALRGNHVYFQECDDSGELASLWDAYLSALFEYLDNGKNNPVDLYHKLGSVFHEKGYHSASLQMLLIYRASAEPIYEGVNLNADSKSKVGHFTDGKGGIVIRDLAE